MSVLGLLILDRCIESHRQLVLDRHVAEGIAKWANVEMSALREYARRLGVWIRS